ncbi:tRNA1(Val) (adenine(37)-N6)-methyltransferase [Fuerstiella marisgermanici]|nr:methyltransferase [Fuerstiella marisgermanici]
MSPPFHFKQFAVQQDRCAMKVGTDAILLGTWADGNLTPRILDIGTGTGVVALMMAQRFPAAHITAVEVDRDASEQAASNFAASQWADRLTVEHIAIQGYATHATFDLIISNPPFFSGSLKPPDDQRRVARHDDGLPHGDLLYAASRLQSPGGRLAVILPVDQGEEFRRLAAEYGLHCHRQCYVKPTPHKPPHRLLMEFTSNECGPTTEPELVVEIKRHEYSPEFAAMAKPFLLKL